MLTNQVYVVCSTVSTNIRVVSLNMHLLKSESVLNETCGFE